MIIATNRFTYFLEPNTVNRPIGVPRPCGSGVIGTREVKQRYSIQQVSITLFKVDFRPTLALIRKSSLLNEPQASIPSKKRCTKCLITPQVLPINEPPDSNNRLP